MAAPVIPILVLGAAGFAVYKAFASDKRNAPGPHNGWRNEAFADREARKRELDVEESRRQAKGPK